MSDEESDERVPSVPDPADRLDDPAEQVETPSVEIPTVENPADRLPDPSEVDPSIRRHFWTAVLWLDVAFAAVVLGPAYALFEGGTRVGTLVTVVGLLAAFRVYQTYRSFQRRDGADADADTTEGADAAETDGTDVTTDGAGTIGDTTDGTDTTTDGTDAAADRTDGTDAAESIEPDPGAPGTVGDAPATDEPTRADDDADRPAGVD